MRKTRNMYNWFRNLSAVLAVCFLISNTTAAQSISPNDPIPTKEFSAWEWSGIQNFVDWWIYRATSTFQYRQKPLPKNIVKTRDSDNNRIRVKTGIIIKDMSVREPGG